MTSLDKLYGTGGKKDGQRKSGLDALFAEREENIINTARELDAEAIILEKQRAVEESRRKLEESRRLSSGAAGSGGGFSAGGSNTAVELIKMLHAQGMELQKATDYVANMDQDTMMKLAVVSGSPGGMNQLLPFILFSKKDTVTPVEMAEVSKKYFEMGQASHAAQASPMSPIREMVDLGLLKPKGDDGETIAYFNDKLERLEEKVELEREARHQADIAHANEMAATRQQMNEDKFKALEAKLTEAQSGGPTGKRTPMEQIEDAVAVVEKVKTLGGDLGAHSPIQEINDVVGTVVNAPGMMRVFDASAQAIRERGMGGAGRGGGVRPQTTVTQAPTAGQNFYCDNCLAEGVRTTLTMTPELIAGTGTVRCPKCGREFANQRARGGGGAAGAGGPGSPPPPGGGQPPTGKPFFPGGF